MADTSTPALNSAVLLAAATAFLYCASTAHFGGYLGPLHLDADVLDRNFHQVLYNGFLISLSPAFFLLVGYGATRLAYSHSVFPGLNDWLRHSASRRRRFIKLRRLWVSKRKDSSDERRQKQHTWHVLTYFAMALAFIISLVYFESLGKKAALDVLRRANENAPLSSEIVRVKIDDKIRSLFYLVCGARNCAGIDPTTKMVHYFPQNGHSYQYFAPPSSAGSAASPSKSP